MKVTAILLFRVKNAIAQPVLLASAMDLSSFSFFEKKPAREFSSSPAAQFPCGPRKASGIASKKEVQHSSMELVPPWLVTPPAPS